MEKFIIQQPIKVFCITATGFPEGVLQAHQGLQAKIPALDGRKIFGISWPDKTGNIIYKAAAELLNEAEAEKLQCETFVLKAGEYISEFIPDFWSDIQIVSHTFKTLLNTPGIDPGGYCLEIYEGENYKDIRCLVPLR